MLKLKAIWNRARGAWETPQTENLICGHSELFSETWPISGTMRNGQVFELPMPELPIRDFGSSSSPSVPTPTVSNSWTDGYARKVTEKSPNRGVDLALWAHRIKLLRTPTAVEAEGGAVHPDISRAKGQMVMLRGQVIATEQWDQFTPAIRRWEKITGLTAPDPTVPDGRDGRHRLSAKFTEWLMGLKPGWITGHGLSRKDEIKMAGNGVVPQQAMLALEILYTRAHTIERIDT